MRSTNATSVLCCPLELYLDSFKVEFPAVTICASGRNDNNLEAGFWNLFLKFMDEAGSPLPYSAVQVANKMRQVASAMWLCGSDRSANCATTTAHVALLY